MSDQTATNVNIFERATRLKLRFETGRGLVSVEDLWDLDLLPKGRSNNLNLDDMGKSIRSALKEFDTEGESLVANAQATKAQNKERSRLQLAFDVIKHVIDVRVSEAKAKTDRQAVRQERADLQELLQAAERNEMAKLTPAEIKAKLAALAAADEDND